MYYSASCALCTLGCVQVCLFFCSQQFQLLLSLDPPLACMLAAFGVVHMRGSRLMRGIRLESLAVHEKSEEFRIGTSELQAHAAQAVQWRWSVRCLCFQWVALSQVIHMLHAIARACTVSAKLGVSMASITRRQVVRPKQHDEDAKGFNAMRYLAICGKSGARHVRGRAHICQPNPAGAARGMDCQARAGLPQRPVRWLGPALGWRGFSVAGSCLRLLQMPCLVHVRARGHSICL